MGKLGVAGYAGFFFAKCIEQGSRLAGLTYWARPGHFASKQLGGIGIGGRSVGTQESIRALRSAYSCMEQILGRTKKSCHELGAGTSEHAALVNDTKDQGLFTAAGNDSIDSTPIRKLSCGRPPSQRGRVTLEVRQEQEHPLAETNSWCTFGLICKPVSALTFIQGCAAQLLVHWPVWIC